MRIALVTTEFITEPVFDGGLANYLHRLALSLKLFGHTPVIFVTADHHETFLFKGIEVHRVEGILKDAPQQYFPEWAIRFYRANLFLGISHKINSYLRKIHDQNPFDIVQYTHLIGLGLLRSMKIPSVVRLSSYTQGIMEAYEIKGNRQQHIWEDLAMRRMDGIYGPSQMVCAVVARRLNRSIRTIESPYLVDIESEDSSLYERYLSDKNYFLFFGTIGSLKGIDTIAKALKTIFRKFPNIYFVFIGKDYGVYVGKPIVPLLYEMAGEYKERVIYLGALRHEQLYPIIKHASIVILPSRIENFSNACVEAMAHKRIVIGTSGTSFEQLIDDGKSGFLCEVDNESSLLDTIDKVMILSPSDRENIEARAGERIQKLDPDIVVNQLIDYYSEIITKKLK